MAQFPKPAEGVDGALPAPRDRRGVLRGLHLARVLRAGARSGVPAGLAERRSRRGRAATGGYLTKELPVANTSIVVVRDGEGTVRAFHNICRHRGNKLVWNDFPQAETSGSCRQFTCKYHGWRYDLDGACTFVQQESEFFDLDKTDYGLVPVHCDVWAGFIFVNLADEPAQSLREFLGPMIRRPRRVPVRPVDGALRVPGRHRLQLEGLRGRLPGVLPRANAAPPGGHAGHAGGDPTDGLRGASLPARRTPSHGVDVRRPAADMAGGYQYPIELATRSGLFGPWNEPDLGEDLPGVNPGKIDKWAHEQLPDLPESGDPDLGDGLVHAVPVLADLPQHAPLRRVALLRPVRDRLATGRPASARS